MTKQNLSPQRLCPQCNQHRPRELFYFKGAGQPKRQRIATECFDCQMSNFWEKESKKVWCWSKAIGKAAAMGVSHKRKKDKEKDIDWVAPLDQIAIENIMTLQQGRCCLTRYAFHYPKGPLPINTTLTKWANETGATQEEKGRIPVLVRCQSSGNWEPGNAVLIAACVVPLYLQTGSIGSTSVLMRAMAVPEIPTADQIRLLRIETQERLKADWMKEQRRINQEALEAKQAGDDIDV